MRTTYNTPIDYGALIDTVVFMQKSKRMTSEVLCIVEFGILDGYSLGRFAKFGAEVHAYDIFDEFNGNHAIMVGD